jgi:hypothetical protein
VAPQTLIFLHLPKTAGTTLAHILEGEYGGSAVLRMYESTSGEELAVLPTPRLDGTRVVMGHFDFGVHRFVPKPSTYISVLREPIGRVISHYQFVRRSPTHYLFDASRSMSLGEFVVACGAEEPNNDQTRLLAGAGPLSSANGQERLIAAKEHLRDHFEVIGITEDFDRSVLLMKRAFGWRTPFYARRNVTRRRPLRGTVPDSTLQVIAAHNELDVELYRYARSLFDAQVHCQGPSLERELRAFKRLNTLRGWLLPLLRSRFSASSGRG